MFTATLGILALIFFPHFISTAPVPLSRDGDTASVKQSQQRRGFVLPLQRRKVEQRNVKELLAGSIGLGDFADIVYTVSAQIGNTTTALNLDTGSSDLWVMTGACQTTLCSKSTATAYSPSNFQPIGVDVNLTYGDSSSGTYAAGPVGLDTVTLAGLSLANQPFAAVNNTDNSAVSNGGAGIIGLGFPSESVIQTQVIQKQFNDPSTTDDFVSNIASYGPFVSRLVVDGIIDQPLFSVTLQRDTIDPSGNGRITVGELPSGVDNSSITWVPVRPYTPAEGGLNPPSFAADEVYPLRWEIPIDNVYLDGKQLPNSTIPRNGVSPSFSSALIDTGNSIIRGPQDVVSNILSTISPAYAANSDAKPILPCASSHTLAFQIGGEMFPVDPLDLISQNQTENASECVASSVVPTDPPSYGALFSWSLGDPFLKSNLVIFYYGNLTHPSVDPPRIGFLSMVPSNASSVLQEVVSEAVQHGGVFSSETQAAPTSSTLTAIPASAYTSAPTAAHSIVPLDRSSTSHTSSAWSSRPYSRYDISLSVVPLLYLFSWLA